MPRTTAPSTAVAGFARSHVYEREAAAPQVLDDVRQLRDALQRRARGRTKLGWSCFGCFLLAPLALAVGFVSDSCGGMAVGLLALVSAIVLAVRYHKNRPFDGTRIDTLEQLTRLLATDMRPDATLRTRLDLRPPDHVSKLERNGESGPWRVRFFADPWLQLGGGLLDGTTFWLQLVTHHQARTKTKRSASGKRKTKHKSKQSLRAQLQLHIKPGRYRSLAGLANRAIAEVRLPQPALLRDLEVSAELLRLKVEVPHDANAKATPMHQLAAMMFLGLYRVLNLARTVDRAQPLEGNP